MLNVVHVIGADLGMAMADGPRQSGGRIERRDGRRDPSALIRIANSLQQQYQLTYTLPEGVKPSERLAVSTTRKGITLTAPTRIATSRPSDIGALPDARVEPRLRIRAHPGCISCLELSSRSRSANSTRTFGRAPTITRVSIEWTSAGPAEWAGFLTRRAGLADASCGMFQRDWGLLRIARARLRWEPAVGLAVQRYPDCCDDRWWTPLVTEDQSAVVDFLTLPSTHDGAKVERLDTHSAIVFLAGDRAYKLKRAVRFDYLDFSTAEKRRDSCDAEVRLNRRMAPTIYRGVVAVTRAPGRRPRARWHGHRR